MFLFQIILFLLLLLAFGGSRILKLAPRSAKLSIPFAVLALLALVIQFLFYSVYWGNHLPGFGVWAAPFWAFSGLVGIVVAVWGWKRNVRNPWNLILFLLTTALGFFLLALWALALLITSM